MIYALVILVVVVTHLKQNKQIEFIVINKERAREKARGITADYTRFLCGCLCLCVCLETFKSYARLA